MNSKNKGQVIVGLLALGLLVGCFCPTVGILAVGLILLIAI